MIALTELRSDETGVHYWRRGADGERIEITRDEWLRLTFWPESPIFDQVVDDLDACRNCLTVDCGCCPGCGGTDADLDPPGSHGYACVM
ncbi:hypothetical protein PBI_OMNICRON_79 [Mycobacterium phage Omnicron]|uniref:Uncharacterized protein n=1 Tax=Mycobacterium phage Omnicron TaxID=1541819 RepID=A0A088FRI7_9CAUD|nr:hypothetical protein PBI_OMNICRON_79 [Mycobacterium phage Omnicron]AIM50412.1 hypothetical protein PBI_OMNICRON_79 [Mycobacterium phage Omnicron]